MKRTLYVLLGIITLSSCKAPEQEEEGQIMEYAGDEDTISAESVDTYEDEDEFDTKWTYVYESYIGIYQDLAIMVLKEQGDNEDGTKNITGYYFYEKYQKNLDLEGVRDPISGKFVLTESYKGETTGYMEFIPGVEDESFWTPASDTDDEQDLNAFLLTEGDPYEMTLSLNHGKYGYSHNVMMMTEEDGDFETTDELRTTIINEEYLAFDLSVTRTNGHLGSISGIAKISGDKAKYLYDEGDEFAFCDLDFELDKINQEITVIENDCSSWHGARATFDGTYKKQ